MSKFLGLVLLSLIGCKVEDKSTANHPIESSKEGTTNETEKDSKTGTRENPIAFGEQVSFTDNWKVKILSVTTNANDLVAEENQFNDPPMDGYQFFMVKLEAIFTGEDSDNFLSSDPSLVGNLSVAYTTYTNGCGVIPDKFDDFADVFTNGRLEGNMCWQVKTEELDSLVLYDANLSEPIYMSLEDPNASK